MSHVQATHPYWVALNIGNTHLRWAYFEHRAIRKLWVMPHFEDWNSSALAWDDLCLRSPAFNWHQAQGRSPFPPLQVAGVVQDQLMIWQTYPHVHIFSLDEVPLQGMYGTLGLDRALALWGAGQTYGWPILAIDAGTAMTFSGADQYRQFVGGAILPGLGLQLSSLAQKTDALPPVPPPESLPQAWARSTENAIQVGVVHSLIAMVGQACQDWWRRYPESPIVMTGGDSRRFQRYFADLKATHSSLKAVGLDPMGLDQLVIDEQLLFKGMERLAVLP